MKTLGTRAWTSMLVLAVITGALLFVPAGTLRYWQAWVYLTVFVGCSALTTVDLIRRDPALLERRLRGGPAAERRPAQRVIMAFMSLGFALLMLVPALDRRFGWSVVAPVVSLFGDALIVLGFAGIARVYRENPFSAATVELASDQRVISTGPYAVVRHPMYAFALLYLLGTPLALASWWAFIPLVAMLPFLLWRLLDEERLLERELPGYREYQERVRHRLLPFLW
jgi:protein-S-isoprenylcysteine O-methyltransferase Ste14